MSAKKIIGIIVSVVFIAAFVFVLGWGIINWNKVKDGFSGSGLCIQRLDDRRQRRCRF